MPEVIVQPGEVVPEHGLPGSKVVGEGEVALVESKRQEVIVHVSLLLVGLPSAPQEKSVAARPEPHVYVHFVAYYSGITTRLLPRNDYWR